MTQRKPIEKPAPQATREKRARLSVVTPPAPAPAPPALVPSSPQPIAFGRLQRAPENVRHVRIDEDVAGLADDIAAHGLLQSLIGYEADGSWPEERGKVMIVGGGRRLQALRLLRDRGVIDTDYAVPVLLRDAEEAIELSLAENLQQRNMSPVDEFLAFKALMDTGHHSPEGLAARFGFSERVVRQHLRLADVVPEVLDALAARRITIDAATAYAATQDRELQAQIFKVQERKNNQPHRPDSIRYDIATKGIRTTDPIFTFVTAEIYERDGGGYEDDLFVEEGQAKGEGRVLAHPFIARAAAERMIDFQAARLIDKLKRDPKLAPTIVGHVRPDSLRVYSWGCADKLAAPAGFVEIDRRYGRDDKLWNTVRNNRIDAQVVIGIGDRGELRAYTARVFVPKAQKDAVDPSSTDKRAPEPSPEERAAAAYEHEVTKLARRLAVGPFAGTRFEGRAHWPTGYHVTGDARTIDGVRGWMIPVQIFVTEAEVDAQRAAAEAEADAAIAARAAAEAHRAALLAADPPPAVVMVDGLAYHRWADGGYWDGPEPPEGEEADGIELGAHSLAGLVRGADTIGDWWTTVEAFETRETGGRA